MIRFPTSTERRGVAGNQKCCTPLVKGWALWAALREDLLGIRFGVN